MRLDAWAWTAACSVPLAPWEDFGRYAIPLTCFAITCPQAVIGAGAAGLVAARELKREGHRVTVVEQGSEVGGIWVYSDDIETDDLLGAKDVPMHASTALCVNRQ